LRGSSAGRFRDRPSLPFLVIVSRLCYRAAVFEF
jgi:hypothetical protein